MFEDIYSKTISKESRYSKRPLWQWIVIYLVIGAIIYGIIYYFFLSRGSLPGY